jgi:hypothetical protein
MGQSFKAILQLFLIGAVITAVVAWSDDAKPTPTTWTCRLVASTVAIMLIWVLWRNMRRKENLPDMLAQACGTYFERDGFCFAFAPSVVGSVCWMNLYFQNRYAQPCHARVVLQPPVKSFGIRRLPLTGIDVDIDCDGGAYGVCRIPWPIDAQMQGKTVACEVACDTAYPNGAGKLLRFREGLRAGAPSGGARRAAVTAGLLLVGAISISRPATASLSLPASVASQLPPGLAPVTEILFRPDLPTGGFPVLPVATAQIPPSPPSQV